MPEVDPPARPRPELLEHPPSSEDLLQRTFLRVFGRLVRYRLAFAPLLCGFALWIGLSDATTWRRALLLVLASLLVGVIAHDGYLIRNQRAPEARVLSPSLVALALMQEAMIFASGGVLSPVTPMILPVVFLTALVSPPRLAWTVALAIHVPAMWLDAWLVLSGRIDLTPTVFAGLVPSAPSLVLTLATLICVAVVLTTIMSTAANATLMQMVAEAFELRDDALLARAEQTRELTTLSGEIAHELKNPLASVKGLAALVQRAELPAKASERMTVLRREVDRMQGILDEFLNFSRPLVPLTQREVELRELVDHVMDLHEGMAVDRRVVLVARGHARLRCDPRKVEQILINLIQNALEVAPSGSEVELEIDDLGSTIELTVRDAGPGLAPELRGRVFEAGVTGKGDGSGLGLTFARALARQHGGELELDDRRDGAGSGSSSGCEARLRLPQAGLEDPGPEHPGPEHPTPETEASGAPHV